MKKAGKPKFFYGYIIVLVAAIILAIRNGTSFSFGVFFVPLSTEFGWTSAMTSSAFSLSMVFYGLASIVVGRLNDRFGPRLVGMVGGLTLGLGYLSMRWVSTVWQLYLFYGLLVGIGMSCFWIPSLSAISRWFTKRRATMTGVVLSVSSIGPMVLPPVTNWLVYAYGWRTSYTYMGILVLVVAIPLVQFLKRAPVEMGLQAYGDEERVGVKGAELKAKGYSLGEAIKTSQFWILITINFVSSLVFMACRVHIVPHAIKLGITEANAAIILVVMAGAAIFSRIIIGGAADRVGYKAIYIICFTVMALDLFWLLIAKELWMLYLFAVISSFGLPALGSPMTAQLFGFRSHGAIFGIATLAFNLGGAVGSLLAGAIVDITGDYQLAWVTCCAFMVAAIVTVLFLRPTRGQGGTDD